MQQGSRLFLFPPEDIPDDVDGWPKDTAIPEEKDDREDSAATLIEEETILSDPPPIELCAAVSAEVIDSYYENTPPFVLTPALPGPSIREMRHPKDRRRRIKIPIWEVAPISEIIDLWKAY
jgi:hypothetical protein